MNTIDSSPPPLQLPSTHSKSPSSSSISDQEDTDVASTTSNYDPTTSIIIYPWSIKGPVLFLVLMLNLGPDWIIQALAPLKSTIVSELKINNAQFGDISSGASLINTFFPFISGVLIDWYGAELLSMMSSVSMLLGAIVAAVGASTSSYPTVLIGEILVGFGSVSIYTAQIKIFTHYFRGAHIGFVYGLNLATGRIVDVLSASTSVPITQGTGFYSWSLWVPAFIAALGLSFNTAFIFYQRTLPLSVRPVSGREIAIATLNSSPYDEKLDRVKGEKVKVKKTLNWTEAFRNATIIPAAFWFITLTQVLQIGATQTYLNLTANIIQVTRKETNLLAGYTAAVQQASSIFLTPCIGLLFDRFGKRMYYVSFGASLWIVVFATMGFTQVNAFVPVVITSLALSINLMPFLATVPILVPDGRLIGTAFGIWKCYENTGHVIISVISGVVQDHTPIGTQSYKNVFIIFISIKSLDVILGLFYNTLDVRYLSSVLRMSEKEKQLSKLHQYELEQEQEQKMGEGVERRDLGMNGPKLGWTLAGLGTGGFLTTVAWILYLVFAK